MAVTIKKAGTKKKTVAKNKAGANKKTTVQNENVKSPFAEAIDTDGIKKLVDEYVNTKIAYKHELAKLKPLVDAIEKFETEFQDIATLELDSVDIDIPGYEYSLHMGKVPLRVIDTDLDAFRSCVDDDVFYKVAKVTVADVKKYTSEEEQEDIFTVERKGKRSITY